MPDSIELCITKGTKEAEFCLELSSDPFLVIVRSQILNKEK